jgi:hypothetical protein
MLTKSITALALTLALAAALAVSIMPAMAAKHAKVKPTGACAQASGRCVSDCDQLNWCTVNACIGGQSTPVPLWRCYQPSGLCLAPHC